MVLARRPPHRRAGPRHRARARRRCDGVRGVRGRDAVGVEDAVHPRARTLLTRALRRDLADHRNALEIDRALLRRLHDTTDAGIPGAGGAGRLLLYGRADARNDRIVETAPRATRS